MAIGMTLARQICSKPELELVLSSTSQEISKLDARALRSKIVRARNLRDKWRDLTSEQSRQTKQKRPARVGESNARSVEKAQLFDETLNRFQTRLDRMEKQEAAGDAKLTGKSGSTRKTPPRAVRSAAHRAVRSVVRETLNEQKRERNVPPARPAKKSATPAGSNTDATTVDQSASASATASTGRKTSGRKTTGSTGRKREAKSATVVKSAGKKAVSKPVGKKGQEAAGAGIVMSDSKNLAARTAARKSAFKRGGATKIQAHVGAQGRRSQARRNKR